MNKRPIDLLMFDFDGTLTDSIPAAVESIQAMQKQLGLPHKTNEEISSHVGYGEEPLVSGSIGSKDKTLVEKAMAAYFEIYLKNGIYIVKPYPHIHEMLEHFKDKIIIIISNKKHDFIEKILKNIGLFDYFKEIYGGDTSPCLKPDPCMINSIIQKYSIQKNRALFIGDMTIDVETGRNAGVTTCAVTYGFDPKEKLAKTKPDFIIDDPSQLQTLID